MHFPSIATAALALASEGLRDHSLIFPSELFLRKTHPPFSDHLAGLLMFYDWYVRPLYVATRDSSIPIALTDLYQRRWSIRVVSTSPPPHGTEPQPRNFASSSLWFWFILFLYPNGISVHYLAPTLCCPPTVENIPFLTISSYIIFSRHSPCYPFVYTSNPVDLFPIHNSRTRSQISIPRL